MGFSTAIHPLGAGEKEPYKLDAIIFESDIAGTYEFKLKKGVYEITMTGGGGLGYNGSSNGAVGGGGSAAFIGKVSLASGNYTIKVGGPQQASSLNDTLIYCQQGLNADSSHGWGGYVSVDNILLVITTILKSFGNTTNKVLGKPVWASGGNSLLPNGYGHGQNIHTGGGTTGLTGGYVKIIYKGKQ